MFFPELIAQNRKLLWEKKNFSYTAPKITQINSIPSLRKSRGLCQKPRHWLIWYRGIDDQRIMQFDWTRPHFSHQFYFFGTQLIFYPELFLMLPYYHHINQIYPWQVEANMSLAGHTWSQPIYNSSLRRYSSLVTILMIWDFVRPVNCKTLSFAQELIDLSF